MKVDQYNRLSRRTAKKQGAIFLTHKQLKFLVQHLEASGLQVVKLDSETVSWIDMQLKEDK